MARTVVSRYVGMGCCWVARPAMTAIRSTETAALMYAQSSPPISVRVPQVCVTHVCSIATVAQVLQIVVCAML